MNRQVPGGRFIQPSQQRSTSGSVPGSRPSTTPRQVNGQLWNQARPGQQPSFAQAISSTNSTSAAPAPPASATAQSTLNLSEFPALGAGAATAAAVRHTGSPRQKPPGMVNKDDTEEFPALPGTPTATVTNDPKKDENDMNKFGLEGILSIIRMEPNDQTTVAIGNDLTNMGLDFNPTSQPLSRTFSSPWIETSKHKTEPEFKLPACYEVPAALAQKQDFKIQNFTEETLFYIFYTMPRDSMQEAAAAELMSRNWRYHKELKLWLTKDPLSEPIQQTNQAERGMYIFFDPVVWEKVKKEYVLYYPDIA
ncbi:hypothetical protein TRVA0_004S01508 [Trichomonascus vanleenenianus]|uniref:CCR4-NOT core subunit CDC36 n=1 Tax=Trichomonascus vanleenenianus TaxID=2268995 RepID=UPI003EC994A7